MIEKIYEDSEILVCIKPSGTQSEYSDAKNSLPRMIMEERAEKCELFTLHRLDREVTGLIVYAKTERAAAFLSREIAEGRMEKVYLAVTEGHLPEKEGTLVDLLFKDSSKNKSYVVKRERRGVKRASLEYTELALSSLGTLYRIRLHTGRTHQIRVQFSSRGCSVVGDRKYGAKTGGEMLLASHRLSFVHPKTKKQMSFEYTPEFAKI